MTDTTTTQQQNLYKILLIGDNCLDVYQYGTIDRISPEAPVPVFKFEYQESKPGMAGNVFNNLKNLGCVVDFIHNKTSTKTRLIDIKSKQHIVRIDDDQMSDSISVDLTTINNYDAIVISDYNKGTVDISTIAVIAAHSKIPVFIDTKKTELARINNAWIKINLSEYEKLKSSCENLIVTLGSLGARHNEKVYPSPKVEVSDVCGAGDTFLAALTVEFLRTHSIDNAIKFANKASAVTVQHIGVYAPTFEEIK